MTPGYNNSLWSPQWGGAGCGESGSQEPGASGHGDSSIPQLPRPRAWRASASCQVATTSPPHSWAQTTWHLPLECRQPRPSRKGSCSYNHPRPSIPFTSANSITHLSACSEIAVRAASTALHSCLRVLPSLSKLVAMAFGIGRGMTAPLMVINFILYFISACIAGSILNRMLDGPSVGESAILCWFYLGIMKFAGGLVGVRLVNQLLCLSTMGLSR